MTARREVSPGGHTHLAGYAKMASLPSGHAVDIRGRDEAHVRYAQRAVNTHAQLVAALRDALPHLAVHATDKDGYRVVKQARAALARACEAGEPTAAGQGD